MFYTASLQEVKIVEFYCSEEAPELSLAMNKVLKLNLMSLEEFEKDWVRTWRKDLFWINIKQQPREREAQFNA